MGAIHESAAIAGRSEALLERIDAGAPLAETLESLVAMIEEHSDNRVLGSVLLLDGDGVHLRHGAAPSLPDAYNDAIDGIAIGASVGSCGTAAYRREPVIVIDIASDPLWRDFRDLAAAHGLRACWSTPILSAGGDVLGTFAMYYREEQPPRPEDQALVDLATRTAAVAIERYSASTSRSTSPSDVQ